MFNEMFKFFIENDLVRLINLVLNLETPVETFCL